MDSIARSTELADRLRCTYDDECTIIHHFFNFRSGKGIGNNLEGLLRSLLFQLIDDSRGHKNVNLDGVDLPKRDSNQQWSIPALKEAMNTVLRQHSHPTCILLDGLDEYEGDKWNLATFVRELANPRVKVCIASRPDSAFNFAFKDLATIKMEEQNTPAINTMVRQTIQFMTGPSFYDSSVAVDLAGKISQLAKGVFLWARFAIEEVRDGLSEGMELPELYRKLDNVPQELEEIYARILERLKPEDRQKSTHMLQLVCYAQENLTLGELYVATALASNEQGPVVEQMSEVEIQRFEKKVLALTGGVLEMFPILDEAHAGEESRETDSEILSHESLETYETDLYEGQEIDESEPHGSAKSDEAKSYKIQLVQNVANFHVSVIHRTFHNYMDSTGWSLLLNARHEGMLHAHVLWLRVCTRVFPASFKGLPPDERSREMMQKGVRATLTESSPVHFNTQLSSRETLGPWPASGKTVDSSLLRYAAIYMLTHASMIEYHLGLRYYEMLQSSMSNSFLCYHRSYTYNYSSCDCDEPCAEPLHPLHLAIGHGLVKYVKAHLSKLRDQGSREWNQISYLDAAIRSPWGAGDPSGTDQISLLEFAVRHADKGYFIDGRHDLQFLIVAEVLEHYPRVHDAAILVALENCSAKVVHLLLSHLPSGKMALESGILNADEELYEDVYRSKLIDFIQKPFNVGPLWYVARRHYRLVLEDAAELIDLFLGRGEDINEQCGPFGTALHGALLRVNSGNENDAMWDLLVSKGADINAVGPFGTPLAFVWRLANTSSKDEDLFLTPYILAIDWLLELGATNNTCDPNGSIPSSKRMREFGHGPKSWEWYQRVYRGEERDEEDERESMTTGNQSSTEREE